MATVKSPHTEYGQYGIQGSCGVPCTWWPPNGRLAIDLPEHWLREQVELVEPRMPSTEMALADYLIRSDKKGLYYWQSNKRK